MLNNTHIATCKTEHNEVLLVFEQIENIYREAVIVEAIKAPRGTRDILGDESWKWAYVTGICRDVADDYGYREVHLPIFEHTELFCRGVGETTDIVEKEMYTFEDRGGRSITLRPEMTVSYGSLLSGKRYEKGLSAREALGNRSNVPLRASAEGPLPSVCTA